MTKPPAVTLGGLRVRGTVLGMTTFTDDFIRTAYPHHLPASAELSQDAVLAGINAAVQMIVGMCEADPTATGAELAPRILAAYGLDG